MEQTVQILEILANIVLILLYLIFQFFSVGCYQYRKNIHKIAIKNNPSNQERPRYKIRNPIHSFPGQQFHQLYETKMLRKIVTRNILGSFPNICYFSTRNKLESAPSKKNMGYLVGGVRRSFASEHRYSQKTTKQIDKEILEQKWKDLQNTFKSVKSSFGLVTPSESELKNENYLKPKKIEYTLQNLRECSHGYPVYLYWQLKKKNSPFAQLIEKIVNNLWKAEQKQTLEFLQFLYVWQYDGIDVEQLYLLVLKKYDLRMDILFKIVRKFQGRLSKTVEYKILKRVEEQGIDSGEYGELLRIINYFTVKKLLTRQFSIAMVRLIETNINKIPPTQTLQAYIYYTYNIDEYIAELSKVSTSNTSKQEPENTRLGVDILKVIQKRAISPQCLKFYTGQQLVAFMHTFLKNNLVLNDRSWSEEYEQSVGKIINRVQLAYFSEDFKTGEKLKMMEICGMMPELKKKMVIALVQKQLLNKGEKFDYNLLSTLFVLSFENNMLTAQIMNKIFNGVLDNIFQMDKKEISKLVYLFTITGRQNIGLLHKKVEKIIEGGLNDLGIRDVCVFVWAMSVANYNWKGNFWSNIEDYLVEELNRGMVRGQKKQDEMVKLAKNNERGNSKKMVNECSWILWAYHNNRQLGIKLIDLISTIILKQFPINAKQTPPPNSSYLQQQHTMTAFELTSIITFYYSIDYSSLIFIPSIKTICLAQFRKIVGGMDSAQLCKCLKYIGSEVWKEKEVANSVIEIFQQEVNEIAYHDIMAVVGILMVSGVKNRRVVDLVGRLLERKKRLESLEMYGTEEIEGEQEKNKDMKKNSRWKLPF